MQSPLAFSRDIGGEEDLDYFDSVPEDLEFLDDYLLDLLPGNPIRSEWAFWDLQRLLASGLIPEDADPDEALNDWMERDEVPDIPPASPLEEAQLIMYQAMANGDTDQELQAAYRAIEISEDCVDAHVVIAQETAESDEEKLEMIRKAVEAGERVIGLELVDERGPSLSLDVGAYPYLRANVALAYSLLENMLIDEAVERLEYLLKRDTEDVQYSRGILLTAYLINHDRRGARSVLKRFPDEHLAYWHYGRALLTFQDHGKDRQATRRLAHAIEVNPYFGACLTNVSLLVYEEPQPFVEDYDLKLEGFHDARTQVGAWAHTSESLPWLIDELDSRADSFPENLASIVRRS